MNDIARGAIAGAVATLPMTATIELINRSLPARQQRKLPPRQITEEVAERTGTRQEASEKGLDVITMVNHFGFGAAAGAAYAPLAPRTALSPTVAGVAYGLIVWAGAYAGVLPALNLQRRPEDRPASLNATMIIGHIVWGASLGIVERRLRSKRRTAEFDEWREYQQEIHAQARTRLEPQEW